MYYASCSDLTIIPSSSAHAMPYCYLHLKRYATSCYYLLTVSMQTILYTMQIVTYLILLLLSSVLTDTTVYIYSALSVDSVLSMDC